MAKLLGDRAVFNRLNKYLQKHFTEAQAEVMEFYNDIEGETSWAWKFDLEGHTHTVRIDRRSGKIEHKII